MRIFWLLANMIFLFVDAQTQCGPQYLTGGLSGVTGTVSGTTGQGTLNTWNGQICGNTLFNNARDQYSLDLENDTIDGVLQLSLCDPFTNFDTMLFIGSGCPSSAATFVCFGSNDDSSCVYNNLYSSVQVSVSTRVYYILVGGYSNARGNYKLHWTYIPSAPTMTRTSSVSETVSISLSVTPSNTDTNTRTNSATSTISRTNTGTQTSSKSSSGSITESVT